MPLDKTALKALAASRSQTLNQLRSSNRAASDAVARQVGEERKALLVNAVAESAPPIVAAIAALDPAALATGSLVDAARNALAALPVDDATRAAALNAAEQADRFGPGTISADLPLNQNPVVRSAVDRADLVDVAEAVKLRDTALEGVLAAANRVDNLDDGAIAALVRGNKMTRDEGAALGRLLTLHHLADGNKDIATALAGAQFPALAGPIKDARDLLRVPTTAVAASLQAANVKLPEGNTYQQVADDMRQRVVRQFPTEALLQKLAAPPPDWLQPRLAAVSTLLPNNRDRFGADVGALDMSAVPAAQRASASSAYSDLVKLTFRYPGLGLEKIVAQGGNPQQVSQAVATRVGLIDRVANQNAGVELLAIDYSPDSQDMKALKLDGIGAADQVAVLATFKAQQRLFALTGDSEEAVTVLEGGYRSAAAAGADDLETFRAKTGLSVERAANIHSAAGEALAGVGMVVAGVIDAIKGFKDFGVGNVAPEVGASLRALSGYADLFGPQDNCNCEHCSSILSPAAYFVDLMYFVEQNVLAKVFTGAKATHALNLSVRRPDLWTLDLTCDNTDKQLPTLDVINEILESYLAKQRNPAIDLTNRSAVRSLVYGDMLVNTRTYFVLPFTLPAATADAYAELFEVTRADILLTLGSSDGRFVAAALLMSKDQYDITTTANNDLQYLRSLYRTNFTSVAGGTFGAVDVQDFLAGTGLTHDQLSALVRSRFVSAGGTAAVTLKAEKSSPASVQNDVEHILGLTADVLDRMHRLLRLWRQTPWSIDAVDLVLEQRVAPGTPPVIDAVALRAVVDTRAVVDRFGIPVEVACALWSPIPTRESDPGSGSLCDRLFNKRPYAATEGPFPKPAASFIVPAFRTTSVPETDNTLQRLLLGLGIDDAGLAALVTGLATALGCDPTNADEARRGFALSLDNLTLLYRHARLAKLLHRSIADLLQLASLAGLTNATVGNLADLKTLLAFEDWIRASSLSLDDVAFVTGGVVQGLDAYVDPAKAVTDIVKAVGDENALTFAETVLAFVPGVTEQMSRQVIAENAGLFDTQGDGALRLKATVPANSVLAVPAGVPATAADLTTAVMRFHTASVLPPRLAKTLGMTTDKLAAIAKLAAIDLGQTNLATALQGGARAPLEGAIAALSRLAVLFRPDAFTPDRIEFVRTHAALVDVANFAALTIASVMAIVRYRQLIAPPPTDPEAPLPDPAAVEEVLGAFTPANKFAATSAKRLAEALATGAPVAATLPAAVVVGNNAIDALTTLAAAVGLITRTGLDVPTLRLLASETASDLATGAEALVSALARKYPDPQDASAQLDPKDDRLRSAKRDALADFMIRNSGGQFSCIDDLYDYFLLDVQLQGCARTSRVVAAISSVQTYVNRILLNLEQDGRPSNAPDHVQVAPDRIPHDEWAWRKNYRVWEANRKVFLWPENYIEPELRDDKTPLFRALEDALLQQDINEQNVLDACGDYLAGFEGVASLKIAGAYHEFNFIAQTDVLHVFGATSDDPPTYYYWTIHNLYHSVHNPHRHVSYSARTKIDVSVPTRRVSPVVYLGRLFVFWTEVQTSPVNKVSNGESRFSGYKHVVRIRFTSLRLDGRWTPPQDVAIDERHPFQKGGVLIDYLMTKGTTPNVPRFSTTYTSQSDAQDGYTLEGPDFERAACEPTWGSQLVMNIGTINATLADLFDRRWESPSTQLFLYLLTIWTPRPTLHVGDDGSARRLYAPTTGPANAGWWAWAVSPSYWQHVFADVNGGRQFLISLGYSSTTVANVLKQLHFDAAGRGPALATLRDGSVTTSGVPGAPTGAGVILQAGPDSMYVLRDSSPGTWRAKRLGTTLARELSRALFVGGVERLLDIATQKTFGEAAHLLKDPTGNLTVDGPVGRMDFTGPLGVYYRETFFHIPFLVANCLNSRQNYRAAQDWYRYILDPTAALDPGTTLTGLTDAQALQVMRDRVWRYIEFRGLTPPRLREILTDEAAIEAYKKDPFNPHAIARLRLSAYQKCIVMKYVGNLIDWGDSLFTQFTMESVNEAIVLYSMAAELLGRRPADVGDCGEAVVSPKSYERIRPWLAKGSEFLLEVESVIWVGAKVRKLKPAVKTPQYLTFTRSDAEVAISRLRSETRATPGLAVALVGETKAPAAVKAGAEQMKLVAGAGSIAAGADVKAPMAAAIGRDTAAALIAEGLDPAPSNQIGWKRTRASGWIQLGDRAKRLVANDDVLVGDFRRTGRVGWAIVQQLGPIFCVPQNKDLLDLWTRVEDRLYKIRHCLDITGARRDLALFAPEIDPRLLVRARAEGLSIEDVLGAASGNLPPYRFTYLIEKARQYVGTAQAFGAQLLSAIEKRDVEQLTKLRNTQQANMLLWTTRLREWEAQVARDAVEQLARQQTAVEYRRDYYHGLIDSDLLPWERTQQVMRHGSSVSYTVSALLGGTAGVLGLVPQLGSPFAMKYGGVELSSGAKGWQLMFSDTAKLLDVLAASAGLEAGNERRREGWRHQEELAIHELKQLEKQISAANLRVKIAERSLDVHRKSIDEQDEIIEFFKDKFSNLGLYVWLSTSLQRIYRQAFNGAMAMARLAERAYRFERNDETVPLLQASYWSALSAGLLSGEALMADLSEMERRFIETNYRMLEVDQPFSMLQLAPAALLALRETGECQFAIPEIAFDLFYPGQYRRRIRAVRLTIPCVTGPYTNVAATLAMNTSFIRATPQIGAANLVEVPLRHTHTVATSTAQSDSGVFDFSFRDERYMPFEGAGAISTWTITLPKNFVPFDYRTITDVIVHINYTALADGVLRQRVEAQNAALEGSLVNSLSSTPLARMTSFRQEFSTLFNRILRSSAGTQVRLEIDQRFLPIFLRGRTLNVSRALLLLRPGSGATGAGFSVKLNTKEISGFAAAANFPGYRQADIASALAAGLVGEHTLSIEAAGDLAPTTATPGGPLCDPNKLQDLVLYVEVGL